MPLVALTIALSIMTSLEKPMSGMVRGTSGINGQP